MAPFKIKVEGWALRPGLAVVAHPAVDAGTEQEHGPWLSILKAADGMRPAESIGIKGRDQLTKLREAIDYALQKPKMAKLPATVIDIVQDYPTCKHEHKENTAEPCCSCNLKTDSMWEPKK